MKIQFHIDQDPEVNDEQQGLYRGTLDNKRNKAVLIKIQNQRTNESKLKTNLKEEYQLLNQIDHENILKPFFLH